MSTIPKPEDLRDGHRRDEDPAREPRRVELSPSVVAESNRAAVLRIARLGFFALFVIVTTLSVLYFQPNQAVPREWPRIASVILAVALVIGGVVISVELLTRQKRIGTVIAIFFGALAAMLGTLAIGAVIDLLAMLYEIDPRITSAAKVLLGIALAYLAVTTILQTQDDFRLVIPYVEFAKQIRGSKPLILDTSSLIDARIAEIAASGLVQSSIVIPRFVVFELQMLADSSDRLVRTRGRRGLDVVTRLQRLGTVGVTIDELPVPGKGVDQMLVEFAKLSPGIIVTNDLALARVAEIQKISVVNINELANAFKPALVPGESLELQLIRVGEQPGQGVGYLEDGTMIVVEHAQTHVGERVEVIVTSTLQTAAGRLIFARLAKSLAASTTAAPGSEPTLPDGGPASGVAGDASLGVQPDGVFDPAASTRDALPDRPLADTPLPSAAPTAHSAAPSAGNAPITSSESTTPVRSPFPPHPPRSLRSGTPRNPRRG